MHTQASLLPSRPAAPALRCRCLVGLVPCCRPAALAAQSPHSARSLRCPSLKQPPAGLPAGRALSWRPGPPSGVSGLNRRLPRSCNGCRSTPAGGAPPPAGPRGTAGGVGAAPVCWRPARLARVLGGQGHISRAAGVRLARGVRCHLSRRERTAPTLSRVPQPTCPSLPGCLQRDGGRWHRRRRPGRAAAGRAAALSCTPSVRAVADGHSSSSTRRSGARPAARRPLTQPRHAACRARDANSRRVH